MELPTQERVWSRLFQKFNSPLFHLSELRGSLGILLPEVGEPVNLGPIYCCAILSRGHCHSRFF